MSIIDQDDECPGCGSLLRDRTQRAEASAREFPDEEYKPYLAQCPHCYATKCNMCDMGDDTNCISCDGQEEE